MRIKGIQVRITPDRSCGRDVLRIAVSVHTEGEKWGDKVLSTEKFITHDDFVPMFDILFEQCRRDIHAYVERLKKEEEITTLHGAIKQFAQDTERKQ